MQRPPRASDDSRVEARKNIAWSPRPGWATVRLLGTCGDRSLRRGEVVLHNPAAEPDVPGQAATLAPETPVIVLSEAAHLVEDDFHLVPESAVLAVGEPLP